MGYASLVTELEGLKSESKKKVLSSFFKTGPGQYGEGDVFLGITVPVLRSVALRYPMLGFDDISKLLGSVVHEHRYVGLALLCTRYTKGDLVVKKECYDFYVAHFSCVNNWDLVDTSAPVVVGEYLFSHPELRGALFEWAGSSRMWTRRVAVVSQYYAIKRGHFNEILKLCFLLLDDKEDLMHKACGWMLREVGKKDASVLRRFLDEHAVLMPRTMLRYAIEKFDADERRKYLGMRGLRMKKLR